MSSADQHDTISSEQLVDGDVVAFESPWHLGEAAFGVVRDAPDGPRVLTPGLADQTARLARSLQVQRVLDATDLLGVDAAGDYHLVYDEPTRIKWGDVGALDDSYPLAARGRSVAEWIQHVERKRGWAEPSSRVREIVRGEQR